MCLCDPPYWDVSSGWGVGVGCLPFFPSQGWIFLILEKQNQIASSGRALTLGAPSQSWALDGPRGPVGRVPKLWLSDGGREDDLASSEAPGRQRMLGIQGA